MRYPTITIIICARNAAEHLRRSLPAALSQDYPRNRFKVLVVDNGSSDDTGAVARELGAHVRPYSRPGVTRARQFGWKICRSELVAYLDADCVPPADWLSKLAPKFTQEPRLAAAGARLVSAPPTTVAEEHIIRAGVLDTDRFWARNALQWPFIVTAGMVVRRSALECVDGFDVQFGRNAGEDADLCWRLERADWRIVYVRDVEIVHHHRSTVPAMLRQVYWYGRGSSVLFAKWREELGWWRYTDWGPYRRLGEAIMSLPAALPKEKYERVRPFLEAADSAAFLLGKWRGALKERVLFL